MVKHVLLQTCVHLCCRRSPNMWKCGCTKDAFDVWAAKVRSAEGIRIYY